MLKHLPVLLAVFTCVLLHAAEEPALDAAKYPQDTAAKALDSIIKALDARDFGYYVTHMILPADKERILKKYGTVQKYAEAKSEAAQAEGMKNMADVLKGLQKESKQTEGETGDVKWTRFDAGREKLQLEKLPDGRWAMNLRPLAEAPKEASKK